MEIEFKLYSPWMRSQVISLMHSQYGYEESEYKNYFESFYEGPFQEKAIMVVAIYEENVIGFQSFFYWPYNINNRLVNSYQSGSSIIHPDYRGRGLFRKLLEFAQKKSQTDEVEFFIGFPVEASFKSFIKDGWKNPFNLKWYIKLNNIISLLLPYSEKRVYSIFSDEKITTKKLEDSRMALANSVNFVKWRKSYQKVKIFYFTYRENGMEIQFGFKINIRKKIIKELIIGEVFHTNSQPKFVENALRDFIQKIKRLNFITMISIAINPNTKYIREVLLLVGFKETSKEIHFIYKNPHGITNDIDFNSFEVYRGDIDTW